MRRTFEELYPKAKRKEDDGCGLPLFHLARVQAEAGFTRAALETADLIPPAHVNLDNRPLRQMAWREVSINLAQRGKTEEALALMRKMEDPVSKCEVLAAIAVQCAREGRQEMAKRYFTQALAVAATASNNGFFVSHKDWALWKIAVAQGKAGLVQEAVGSAYRIHDEKFKRTVLDDLWKQVAAARLEQGKDKEALEAALAIRKPSTRAETLRTLAARTRTQTEALKTMAENEKAPLLKTYLLLGLAERAIQN